MEAPASDRSTEWTERLFRLSVQKQEKFAAITGLLGDVSGKRCLDVGGDNGVVSSKLRQLGGTWHSADLDEASVSAIRRVVGERVHRVTPDSVPFDDDSFDVIVIVDYLEHVHEDRAFVQEVARVLEPSGVLIVNVPYRREEAWLYRLRERLGIGDEKHGHVRPGYTESELAALLRPHFAPEETVVYSHAPLELLDVALNAAYALARREGDEWGSESDKGALVTDDEMDRHRGKFRLLRAAGPLFAALRWVDRAPLFRRGYKLAMRARAAG